MDGRNVARMLAGLATWVSLMAVALLLGPVTAAQAATVTVTNTNDTVDLSDNTPTGDGVSLREAIRSINQGSDLNIDVVATGDPYGTNDQIVFNIAGVGVKTIGVSFGGLPPITKAVTIDGFTQGIAPNNAKPNTQTTGNDAVLLIALDGSGADLNVDGLFIASSGVVVRGLVIGGFQDAAITVDSLGVGATIAGCFIGVAADGSTVQSNSYGVRVSATGVTVGGPAPADRNVISGNTFGVAANFETATGVSIQGSYIGTNASGTVAKPNSEGVSVIGAAGITIGGTGTGAGNLISGNLFGIRVLGTGDGRQIQGNYIGTNALGKSALGNTLANVSVEFAPNVTIGGTSASARNVISGSSGDGIAVSGLTSTGVLIQGNYIGTDYGGSSALANSVGIHLFQNVPSVTIGGTTAGAGNLISGNVGIGTESGILVEDGASGTLIQGNRIGTNVFGTGALGNGTGINVQRAPNTMIGGTTANARNVIASSSHEGIAFMALGSDGSKVQGNYIGVGADGTTALGNTIGVAVFAGANITIGGPNAGEGNLISNNGPPGIAIAEGVTPTTGITVRGNSIFGNNGLGIDLGPSGVTTNDPGDADTGANNRQNFPVISSVAIDGTHTRVAGTINSAANTTFTLDFYSNSSCNPSGNGEGQNYLGSGTVSTTSSNNATFSIGNLLLVGVGAVITATATDPDGNTSEFSACYTVSPKVEVAPQAVLVTEGGATGTFTVALDTVPTDDVTIMPNFTPGQFTLSPSIPLVFHANASAITPVTVTVTAVDDQVAEGEQNTFISFSATSATDLSYNGISVGGVAVIITDNDPTPTLSVADLTVAEPASGSSPATLTVSMTPASAQTVTVLYGTTFGTATGGASCSTAGVDYVDGTGALTFNPGDTSKPVNITICADNTAEPSQTFSVLLSNPSGGQAALGSHPTATVTITNTGGVLPAPLDYGRAIPAVTTLTVPAPGLLADYPDVPGSPQVQIVTQPAYGSVSLSPDGGFTYTPSPTYSGTDFFTFRVTDGTHVSPPARATITMIATKCGPRPRVLQTPVAGGGQLQVTVQTSAFSDGGGPTPMTEISFGQLQNARVTLNGQTIANGQVVTLPPGTTTLTFTVQRLTAGQAVTVPYTVKDGCGSWQTFVGGGTGATGF